MVQFDLLAPFSVAALAGQGLFGPSLAPVDLNGHLVLCHERYQWLDGLSICAKIGSGWNETWSLARSAAADGPGVTKDRCSRRQDIPT